MFLILLFQQCFSRNIFAKLNAIEQFYSSSNNTIFTVGLYAQMNGINFLMFFATVLCNVINYRKSKRLEKLDRKHICHVGWK